MSLGGMGEMLKFLTIILGLISAGAMAQGPSEPQHAPEYICANQDEDSHLLQVRIYKSQWGDRSAYEAHVIFAPPYAHRNFIKSVYQSTSREGKRIIYTGSSFWVKINLHQTDPLGRYMANVRIPSYQVHSKNWVCKSSKTWGGFLDSK